MADSTGEADKKRSETIQHLSVEPAASSKPPRQPLPPWHWHYAHATTADADRLFPTKRPNGLLQVLHAGEPQGVGRGIDAAKLLG